MDILTTAFQAEMKSKGFYLVHDDGSERYFMSFVEIDTGVQLRIDPIPYDGQYEFEQGYHPPPDDEGVWPYLSTLCYVLLSKYHTSPVVSTKRFPVTGTAIARLPSLDKDILYHLAAGEFIRESSVQVFPSSIET